MANSKFASILGGGRAELKWRISDNGLGIDAEMIETGKEGPATR
jgi:hypothetical protein